MPKLGLKKNFPIFAVPLRWDQRGGLAQLVEHRTENPCVPGSSPGSTTMIDFNSLSCPQERLFFFIPHFENSCLTSKFQISISDV